MMKGVVLNMMISSVLGVSSAFAADVDPLQAYRDAVKGFGGELKQTLGSAIKTGGPVAGISICYEKAAEIARTHAETTGWQIGRTSLKLRNPNNAPTAQQKAILEEWEKNFKSGDDPAALETLQTIEIDGQKKQLFMKGIGMAAVCMNCHGGDSVTPEVEAKLKELYPEDQARGYQPGDLRGAFVIIADVPES